MSNHANLRREVSPFELTKTSATLLFESLPRRISFCLNFLSAGSCTWPGPQEARLWSLISDRSIANIHYELSLTTSRIFSFLQTTSEISRSPLVISLVSVRNDCCRYRYHYGSIICSSCYKSYRNDIESVPHKRLRVLPSDIAVVQRYFVHTSDRRIMFDITFTNKAVFSHSSQTSQNIFYRIFDRSLLSLKQALRPTLLQFVPRSCLFFPRVIFYAPKHARFFYVTEQINKRTIV